MKGRTDGRTVDDVMVIKPNFLASMGYQYFLSYGAPCVRSSAMIARANVWFVAQLD